MIALALAISTLTIPVQAADSSGYYVLSYGWKKLPGPYDNLFACNKIKTMMQQGTNDPLECLYLKT